MICFGGSDPGNLTQRTLQVTLKFAHFKKIIIITGTSYQLTGSFKRLITSDNRVVHKHYLNEKQMLNAMLEAELAIVPASGILLEALAAGCVVISGKSVDNQNYMYENVRSENLFSDAGNFGEAKLSKAIFEVLDGNVHREKHIDGQSTLRIIKLFLQLNKEFSCKLRSCEFRRFRSDI